MSKIREDELISVDEGIMDTFLNTRLQPDLFLEVDKKYRRTHDDCEGVKEQCIEITLKEDSGACSYFEFRTPISSGMRFRNSFGGGISLSVYNAIKVLVYAHANPVFHSGDLELPGFGDVESFAKPLQEEMVECILHGIVILPQNIYTRNSHPSSSVVIQENIQGGEFLSSLEVHCSIDGDMHIIAYAAEMKPALDTAHPKIMFPSEPFIFTRENSSDGFINALLLLAIAIKRDNELIPLANPDLD